MSIFNLKSLKESSVYITPNLPVSETKRYKVGLPKLALIVGLYTILIALIVTIILALSPARRFVFIFESKELKAQELRIKELEGKIVFLTHQLQTMASTNQKLKYVMMLAGSDSLDSTSAVYDSLRINIKAPVPPPGGNIYYVFSKFMDKYFGGDDDTMEVNFMRPTDGVVVNQFNASKGHMGIDYGIKDNTPVVAAAGGLVVFAGYTIDDGYTIILEHPHNFISIYKHCSSILKHAREYVEQGELIALSGNTGTNTTGPHLHFELWEDGRAIDPEKLLLRN